MKAALDLSLRSFDDGVREGYARLFPGDPDKTLDMLEWRFKRNPHGPAKFAVASCAGELVGMIALVPTRLRSGTQTTMAYQAIDTVVDPAQRGQGVFVRLGELAQDRQALGASILWGLPNANAAPGWYGRLGWRDFGAVPMLIRPLRTGFLFGRLHRSLRGLDVPLIGKASETFEVLSGQLGAPYKSLWDAVAPGLGVTVDRPEDWMRWRLFDKPRADYRVVGAGGGSGLEVFVATRIADKHGARLCYVLDAIGRPEKQEKLAAVLHGELAHAAKHGAEAALAWCALRSPSYAAYRKAGFLPFLARLRPIEINFGVRPLDDEGSSFLQPHWRLSLLDSDGVWRAVGRVAARAAARLGGSVA